MDRPSYQERLALFECDAARMDPSATGWPTYPAVPPLLWNDQLAQSSRAHSMDMRDTPCFQHPSCDGTDTFVRIQMYYNGPFTSMAENIAAGVTDGQTVITNWINEIGAPQGETGHRDNMFAASENLVGFGYLSGGTQFQGYWTQDFAGTSVTIPPISAGSHFPQSPSTGGGMINFGAVYYDAGGKAPDRVEVQIGNKTYPLTLQHGKASAGSYVGLAPVPMGCNRYYFRSVIAGKGSIYPDQGTLGIATPEAQASCPDYMAGGVSANPIAGGGGGGAGCSVSGKRSPTGIALLSLLVLVAVLRRRKQ
jgi:uncharacterized protein (TIGR03382 family)